MSGRGKIKPTAATAPKSVGTAPKSVSRPISTVGKIKATGGASVRGTILSTQEEERKPREFTREYQFYKPRVGPEGYRSRKGEYKLINKWGQRKLAIGTIQFFTLHWDPKEHPNPVCLYVGSAPGYTILIMNQLFPNIQWHLYDLSEFPDDVANAPNVTIHPQFFEDEDVNKWKNEKSLFFISDIRDPAYGVGIMNQELKWERESIVIRDMKRQEKWVYELNPVAALLKFRLPWIGNDYYVDNVGKMPYLQGHVYLQSWDPATSTETRLVPIRNKDGQYYSVLWDAVVYEDTFYFHNTAVRNRYNFKNPFGEGNVDGAELTTDWDSLNEVQTWRDYLAKVGLENEGEKGQENVIKLSRNVTNIFNKYMVYRTLKTARVNTAARAKPTITSRVLTAKEERELEEKRSKEREKEEESDSNDDVIESSSDGE